MSVQEQEPRGAERAVQEIIFQGSCRKIMGTAGAC